MSPELEQKAARLKEILNGFPLNLIAYSGGVDSGLLLWVATHQSSAQATGIIADSESLKRSELEAALHFADTHQLTVETIHTSELDNPDYSSNPLNRCYYCKHTLFESMTALAAERKVDALCYGENADDAHHDRPGRQAAQQFDIRSPLQEAGLTKNDVRSLARHYGLEIAEKKAQPCLASRITHGVEVTAERLQAVENAEAFIHSLGFDIVRVRHHENHATVLVSPDETSKLLEPTFAGRVIQELKSIGFAEVELDATGYQGAGLQ